MFGTGIRTPFFYGWVVVFVGGLVVFSSGPGQSYVYSVFIDSIIEDTDLDRTIISTLYAVGTGISALTAMVVSRVADRTGPRITLIVAGFALGCACFAMSLSAGLISLFIAFAALRALGQGSIAIHATLITAQWFVRHRGRAMSIMGLGITLSIAALPPLSRLMIDHIGWREAYMVLGVMVWVLIIPAALWLLRDHPEDVGMYPDGDPSAPPGEEFDSQASPVADQRRVFTSLTFWMLAIPVSVSSLLSTSLIFHQTSIFEERGLDASVAANAFIPYAAASAVSLVIAGYVVEQAGPRVLSITNMVVLFVSMLAIRQVSSPSLAYGYAALMGCSLGLMRTITSVTWAHFYGRIGLGRIHGAAMMVNITASALGPMPLAWMQSWFGRFSPGLLILSILPFVSVALILAARPQRNTLGQTVTHGSR